MKKQWIAFLALWLQINVGFAAALEDGIAAFEGKNYDKALPLLQAEAEKGVAKAQGLLARMYANAWGTSKDRAIAVKWAKLAAAQGDAAGQNVLGVSYRNGDGLPKDYAEAVKWYRRAADQGYALGQANLGWMYQNGLGVEKNYDEAVKWYRLASEQGNDVGQHRLATMYREGWGVSLNVREAFKLLKLSADQGNGDAMVSLGFSYQRGIGTAPDNDEAVKWYRLAADKNIALGKNNLGAMYMNGFGVKKDYAEAMKWFRLSADQENDWGQRNVGQMYEMGWGVPQDFEEAARWYLLAAEKGNEFAKGKLTVEVIKAAVAKATAKNDIERKKKDELAKVDAEQTRRAAAEKALDESRQAQKIAAEEAEKSHKAQVLQQQADALAERLREQQAAEDARLKKESQAIVQQQKLLEQQQAQAAAQAATTKAPAVVMAQRRALVIGNDNYKHVSKLQNAREDAKSMADGLQKVGYHVTLKLDLNQQDMKAALRNFKGQVDGGDEVMVFYAGHGVQIGAANYLLPVDITGESEDQIKDDAIQLQKVLDDMTDRKAKFTLAMIDACRDNPFKSSGRQIGGRGLSPTTAATGQMVVFSAGTGQQALDKLGPTDKSKNGLFTRIFLKEMQKPGVSIDRVVRSVRNEVVGMAKSVGHEQVPAIYDQVVGEFYFRK